jgi:glycosyltransferase involved in cell wall biosynthesis
MISTLKRRYAAYRYVLVVGDFHSEGGAWRSINFFYKTLQKSGVSVLLVDLRRSDGWKQWVCSLLFSPRIVVNGMAAVERWHVLVGLLLRKDAAIYLHDTEYMLAALQQQKPLVYKLLSFLLRERPVLCVSERMAALYRNRFGARHTEVVYELTEIEPEPVLETGWRHIVMAGSLNRRKGYPLFVRTAELAAERGLPWTFHWVGGLGESDLAPISPAIRWWGWRDSTSLILKQADVFFLSSIDDPQPLACLEALSLGKRVVVYAETGSAEIVEGLPGCRVFANHDSQSALAAIENAMEEEPKGEMHRSKLIDYAGVVAFQNKLDSVLGARNA